MSDRRRFFAKASGAMAAVTAATILDAPNVIAQPKVQWRMSTAFPPALDVQKSASELLAKIVEETTAGRLRIEVFPGGQIMPCFDCFGATRQGRMDAYYGPSHYRGVKEPGLELFSTLPIGMNPEGMSA